MTLFDLGRILSLLSALSILFLSYNVSAEDFTVRKSKREGMESVQVGPASSIEVPAGAKVYQNGSFISTEATKEFVGRRFAEIDEKIQNLTEEQSSLKDEIDLLKDQIEMLKTDRTAE